MNEEEEGILEVLQQSHPPSLIQDQSPIPAPEQLHECESLNVPNEPPVQVEAENVDGGEGVGATEIPVLKDELILETEGKGEDEVSTEAATVDDGLIDGGEDLVVEESDGGGRDQETLPAGDEGVELMGEGKAMEEEEQAAGEAPVEVKESFPSPDGDADNEGKGQVDVETEVLQEQQNAPDVQQSGISCEEDDKLDEDGELQRDTEQDSELEVGEETAQVDGKMNGNMEMEEEDTQNNNDDLLPPTLQDGDMIKECKTEGLEDSEIEKLEEEQKALDVQQSRLTGEEDEKFDGDGHFQRDIEQDVELHVGEETSQVDEKMDGNREIEEEDALNNVDDLFPLTLHDGDMTKECKTEALDIGKGLADSEIGLEDVKREFKEEAEEMEVEEDMRIKEDDKAMDGGEEIETEKATEVMDETEVQANKEKRVDNEERHADAKEEEMPGGEENEIEGQIEEEEETEVKANKEKEVEEETRPVDAKEEEETLGGEVNEVEGLIEEEEETEVKAHTEKEVEEEMRPVDAMEDEEMRGAEEKEVEEETDEEEETEVKENTEKDMEDEERQSDAKEDDETEVDQEREVGEAEKETEEEEEREMEADEEKEIEDDRIEESPKSSSGKRKRGEIKAVGRTPPKKTVGEDVCFICLDGGDLVFCDRRGCRKAYHPSCAELDEAFFQLKGRWNCGWHSCKLCKKAACFLCYTCQFALCKGCAKSDAIFICVRGNKGLCETCIKSVMLIENNEGNDEMDQASADEKSHRSHLFKDYWTEQKEMLSLTLDEIAQAKSRWMQGTPAEVLAGNPNRGIVSDTLPGNAEATDSKRKKPKKRMKPSTKEVEYDVDYSSGKAEASGARKKGKRGLKFQSKEDYDSDNSSKDNVGSVTRGRKAKKLSKTHGLTSEDISSQSSTEWASKELLDFVVHMKVGDRSPLSQYDVQELLLEYIQRNKLRDPKRKSQIVCDTMLQKLFGKPRVGHFEMLKLLELHFLLKEDSQPDDNQGSVVDAEGSHPDADENADSVVDLGKYKGRKARKKGYGRGLQSNLDEYAAIDTHNITLIYLRRNLIEALLEDTEGFHEKVVGSFVRIRIPGSNQKQDIYRLVQIIGTNKAEPYKVGKRIAYCMLEILNLNKTEVVSIDTISNQEFTEDECKRLRQSIKCGLISRLTVGDVLDKAKDLQAVRVADWLETETTRLNHLRDRASDLGRKKELRECVEKLQLLSTPEERQRRLDEIPVVHADPNMDPSHESEDESEPEEKGQQEINVRQRETSFQWREREHLPSRKGDSSSTDPWSPTAKPPTRKWEPSRSLSGKGFSTRLEDNPVAEEIFHGSPWSPVREKMQSHSTSLDSFKTTPDSSRGKLSQYSETRNHPSASAPSNTSPAKNPTKIGYSEKLWHYKDPTGKDHGPFSVTQLQKWNKSGYFPANLHIWKTGQSEDDAIFLTEALAGRFERLPSQMVRKPVDMIKVDQNRGVGNSREAFDRMSPVMQTSRPDTSSKGWTSHSDTPNLSSTPPSQKTSSGWSGRSKTSRWSGSPTPIQLPSSTNSGSNGMLPSPTPESSRGFNRSHLTQKPTLETVNYAHQQPPQSIAETVTASTLQPGNSQNLAVSAHGGWGSGGYMPNPETTNNINNTNNAMHLQGQQTTPYGTSTQWTNAPANNLPPPTYGNSGTFHAQNPPPALPSQAQWTPQLPTAQPNMQWATMAAPDNRAVPTTQYPGNPSAGWAPMQQPNPNPNPNLGWGAPAGQYGSQPGPVAAPPAAGQMQQGNTNMTWQPAGNMNPGWGPQPVNPAGPGPWSWQQPPGHGGMGPPGVRAPMRRKGQMPCPFFKKGYCKKGASCDFSHN